MFALKAPSPTFLGILQTVARVATENWKLQVKWNSSQKSFTDCRTFIEIGWNAEFILLGCANLAEWTAAMKGIMEHEIAHNLFSETSEIRGSEVVLMAVVMDYFEQLRKNGMPKDIANFIRGAVEDGRVNRLHVNMSPAMIQALRWVNELHYRNSCQIMKEVKEPLAWALNSFLERTRCGKDLENVPEDTVRFLDSIQKYIEEGLFATSSSEMIIKAALPIAEAFIDEFPSLFIPAHLLPKLEHGIHRPIEKSDKSKRVPDRGMDVRVKPKIKPEPETKSNEGPKKPEKEVSFSPSEEKPEEVEEVIKPNEETIDTTPPDDEKISSEGELSEEPVEGTAEVSENELVSEEDETGSDDLELEDEAKSSGFDGNDEPEPTEDGDSEDLSKDVPDLDESFSEEDKGEVLDEDGVEDDSDEHLDESGTWVDGEGTEGAIDMGDSAYSSPSTSEDDELPGASTPSDDISLVESSIENEVTEDEAEEALEKISKWAESVVETEIEDEVDFSELFSASEEEASEFSTKDEAMEREVRAAQEEARELEVDKRLFSVGIHKKVEFKEVKTPDLSLWVDLYAEAREGVATLIDESCDALNEYLVHQKRSAQRNLRSGRIDPRRLWRASGLLDGRIFMERETPSTPTDVAVYLLLDMSASMASRGRIENARKSAIILTEMLEEFGVAHTVVAYTADSYGRESVEHYRLVNWGETEKHRLMFYHDAQNNRDGYSLRVAAEELSKRSEKAKILLMLSDGLPDAYNCVAVMSGLDRKDRVLNDVASAVEEAKEKKVEVLHLYFGGTDKQTLEKVAYMYPKLSVIMNPVDVPGAVADIVVSTLRKYM